MAGGLGLRLRPLTDSVPKPMVQLAGGKPMLQEIIERYRDQGFKEFVLTVHYRANVITSYFGDGSEMGIKITYVHEAQPMGTAGSLRNIPEMKAPFIVSNADVLCNVDYEDMLAFHRNHECLATVGVAAYQEQVPYGVAEIRNEMLTGVKEKPVFNHDVLSGIYVLEPEALKFLPRTGPAQMPDLLLKLKDNSTADERLVGVSAYPIVNHWQDIGTLQSLEKARAA